jgi:hypothetical protein
MSDDTDFDLNITHYTMNDILTVFHLPLHETITLDHLKRAKRIVVASHPDKGTLGPAFFPFYYQAYQRLIQHYHPTVTRVEARVERDPEDEVREAKIKESVTKHFSLDQFNAQFESQFRHLRKPARDNQWFTQAGTAAATAVPPPTMKDVNDQFEWYREQQKQQNQQQVVVANTRNNRQEWIAPSSVAVPLYDEVNEGEEEEPYVSSDLFTGRTLAYDDIRRVHRDQQLLDIPKESAVLAPKMDRLVTKETFVPMSAAESARIAAEQAEEERRRSEERRRKQEADLLANEHASHSFLRFFMRLT